MGSEVDQAHNLELQIQVTVILLLYLLDEYRRWKAIVSICNAL